MTVGMDVVLRIRRGSSFTLRIIIRKVSEVDVSTHIFEIRVREWLGCDNRETLLEAMGRYKDSINAACRFKQDGNKDEGS